MNGASSNNFGILLVPFIDLVLCYFFSKFLSVLFHTLFQLWVLGNPSNCSLILCFHGILQLCFGYSWNLRKSY